MYRGHSQKKDSRRRDTKRRTKFTDVLLGKSTDFIHGGAPYSFHCRQLGFHQCKTVFKVLISGKDCSKQIFNEGDNILRAFMPTNLSLAEGITIKVFAFCDFHFQRDVFSDIKTISVEQKYCEYYVEGNHEAIIRKDVFMRVQSEIARRANLNPDGKRRVYSSRYALSGMVYCGHCGDIYRRVKWNNRGCKSTVWRCVSRVLKKDVDFDCPARTVKEEVLQGAVVTAVNDAYARKNAVISLLKTNIQETVFDDLEAKIAAIDELLADLQQQMIDNSDDNALVEELGLQMDDLRGDRQDILAEAAERTDLQARMNDMIAFLEEMPSAVTEYSEALARRLVDRITIFDERIVVELKSGLQMEVEE